MDSENSFQLKNYRLKSPIKEPEIPSSDLLALSEPLVHPDSAHVSLIYVPQISSTIHYAPTISCMLSVSSNSQVQARALINTSGNVK